MKQRRARGFYDRRRLGDKEFETYLRKWLSSGPEDDDRTE